MKNKSLAFVAGFFLSLGILLGSIYFFSSSPDKQVQPQSVLDRNKLNVFENQTNSLSNYGDLPVVVNNEEIGKSNPFQAE